MSSVHDSKKTNSRVVPQNRQDGTGAGRKLFPWKAQWPWLVMAAEQMVVLAAGSEGALLEDRNWAGRWGVTPEWLRLRVEQTFPGLPAALDGLWGGDTPWEQNLKNRVYKMYYSGTSDRGTGHDPRTRATVSREHWRYWPARVEWEETVVRAVARGGVVRNWGDWVK